MSEIWDLLQKLGLGSYVESLIAEGFDTWETLADITESDMTDLKFKLGHRRKLQRIIADHRQRLDSQQPSGNHPDFHNETCCTTFRPSVESMLPQTTKSSGEVEEPVRTKRKYRRHPKPDVHAPERPPSAYVIFSNHMREILKDRERSFTEMAKCVGEKWQELAPDEREKFERQASQVKEKYLSELTEYKKTDNYRTYQTYLAEFKAKNGRNDTETKRAKLHNESSISTVSSHEVFEPARLKRSKSGGSSYTAASSPPDPEPTETQQQQHRHLEHRHPSSPPQSFYPKIQFPERRGHRYKPSMQESASPPLLPSLPYDAVQDAGGGRRREESYHKVSPPTKLRQSPSLDRRTLHHHLPLNPYVGPTEPSVRLPPLTETKQFTRGLAIINSPLYPHSHPEHTQHTSTTTTTLPGILDLDVGGRSRRILPAPVRTSAGPSVVLNDLSPASGITTTPSTPITRPPLYSMAAPAGFHSSSSSSDAGSGNGSGSGGSGGGGGGAGGGAAAAALAGLDDARASSSLAALLRAGEELAARDEGILAAGDRSVRRPP